MSYGSQQRRTHRYTKETHLHFHCYPSLILRNPLSRILHIPLAFESRELFSPLNQKNAVVADQVIDSQSFQFAQSIHTVQINVIERGRWASVFMYQSKGGTGHVFLRGRLEALCDSLYQR